MPTFYIPTPGNPDAEKNISILLDGLHRNFPGQLTVSKAIKIETDCTALIPMLGELSGAAPELKPTDNGKSASAICPWCKKEFQPKAYTKSPYCSRTCAQQASGHERAHREFQVVDTGRKLSAKELDEAIKAGDFVTGTRIRNFKTKDEFYVNLTVAGDEIKYELLTQPIDN